MLGSSRVRPNWGLHSTKPTVSVASQQTIGHQGEPSDRAESQHLGEESTILKMREQFDKRIKTLMNGTISSDEQGDLWTGAPY